MNSVQQYYAGEFNNTLPDFPASMLSTENMALIQQLLGAQLSRVTENPALPEVQWTAALVDALVEFAHQYRLALPTAPTLAEANFAFADQMLSQNEARYYETAFWRRWCEQGIPDPNNIPLPLEPERTDFTVETSNYMLSDPIGYRRFPTC